MTDEEYDALDEKLTRNPPRVGPDGTGWLAERDMYRFGLDKLSVTWLMVKARALHKSPAKLINEMVLERIVAETECNEMVLERVAATAS